MLVASWIAEKTIEKVIKLQISNKSGQVDTGG